MHLSFRRVLSAITVLLAPALAHGAIPAAESQALANLYSATGGASWTHKNNWLGGAGTECTWYGITCDAGTTHVVGIVLSSNNLNGTLSDLSPLTALQTLNISGNRLLTGQLDSLAGLAELRVLSASSCALTGSVINAADSRLRKKFP